MAPARIEVRNKVPVSVVAADDTRPIDPALFTDLDTIDELYAYLVRIRNEKPERFEATYDAGKHFPKDIFIDHGRLLTDDEMSISVRDFEELP